MGCLNSCIKCKECKELITNLNENKSSICNFFNSIFCKVESQETEKDQKQDLCVNCKAKKNNKLIIINDSKP